MHAIFRVDTSFTIVYHFTVLRVQCHLPVVCPFTAVTFAYPVNSPQLCTSFVSSANFRTLMDKGKERKSIYIAPFLLRVVSKQSDMDHTVLPANYTMPAFPL